MNMPITQLMFWISKDAEHQQELLQYRKEQKKKLDAEQRKINAKR
jgi:hypothetical protein